MALELVLVSKIKPVSPSAAVWEGGREGRVNVDSKTAVVRPLP